MSARRGLLTFAVALMGVFVFPGWASAYTAASGYKASDYATGFPVLDCCGRGPIGIAFDASDNLYVGSQGDNNIYRFQPGGGAVGGATRLNSSPITGGLSSLVFTKSHLYLARPKAGDIVEIDQGTGAIKRTVVDGLECPLGAAVDPKSGDLFVSQEDCNDEIVRVSGFADGKGTVSTYTSDVDDVDGLAFGSDGTLYAASAGRVLSINGTDSASPGVAHVLASVPHADGVAVGVPGSGEGPFLVVNGTDGRVTRLDLSSSPPKQSPILSDGTRGDFVAVDSRGCLYATQTDRILKIAPKGGGCDLEPSTPSQGTVGVGLVIDTLGGVVAQGPKGAKCVLKRRLVVRVRQRGRVRLKFVKVYVKGKHRKTLRHRRVSAPIVIKHVPRGRFTVKMVARTTKGKKVTGKKRFRNCSAKVKSSR